MPMSEDRDPADEKIESFGAGRPIIFLHGWQLAKNLELADFEPAFEGRGGWRRIYTDLPGMGTRSDEGGDLINFNSLLDWVLDFINTEAPGEPFAIAGMSVGGQLARGVADAMPDRCLGLLLRAPRLIAKREERSIYDPRGPKLSEMGRDERDLYLDRDDIGAPLPVAFHAENANRDESWAHARARANLNVLKRIEAEYELDPLPTKVFERPTLIIVGRQDSRVGFLEALATNKDVPPALGIALHKQYPRATIVALDRAGHALPVGSPDLFHALVRDWLFRMEELL
jgi:pimeloyl-ACP methyl ester carboxylesterase